jgi:hypothetical protein
MGFRVRVRVPPSSLYIFSLLHGLTTINSHCLLVEHHQDSQAFEGFWGGGAVPFLQFKWPMIWES